MRVAAAAGMSEQEFWLCTPRYLSACQKAWEEAQQSEWERARYVAFYVVKTVDSKNRFRRMQQLTRFPWEAGPVFPKMSAAEMQRFDNEADEVLRKTNPELYALYMAGKQKTSDGKNNSES